MIVIGIIWMVIARLRLASIGPRKRKGGAPAGPTPPQGISAPDGSQSNPRRRRQRV
jgi:hypothetical protein